MCWLYVPGLADSNREYGSHSLPPAPSLLSKGKPLPLRSWSRAWRMGGWITLLSGVTFGPSTQRLGLARWISSLRVTRAKASQTLGPAPAQITSSGSGMTCGASFARWDRDTSSWRTSQLTLDGVFDTYSGTFPRAGGLRSGTAFLRQPSAPITVETGFLCLLPTPMARDYRGPTAASREGGEGLPNALGQTTRCLSPMFVEWMMGWPVGWTCVSSECTCAETV